MRIDVINTKDRNGFRNESDMDVKEMEILNLDAYVIVDK